VADKDIKVIIETILQNQKFIKGMQKQQAAFQRAKPPAASFFQTLKKGAALIIGGGGLLMAIQKLKQIVVGSIKNFANFEQAIANVKSVSGGTTKELEDMAKTMGMKGLGFNAKEAADAMYFLASAGLSVVQMKDVLEPALRLAAAAQMDIASATDLVVNNLKTFGGEMGNAEKFVDIMAKTVASANTDMTQLGAALQFAGSIASVTGASFKDVNVLLASMADLGIKGGKAGVQLRMAFVRLLKPTSKAADILKNKYNISLKDLKDNISDPIKLIKMLKDANIQAEDSLELFGVRQSTVIKLIQDGIPTIDKLTEKIGEAGGAAEKMAKTQLLTLSGQLKILKAELFGVSIESGGMRNSMMQVVLAFRMIINRVQSVINEFKLLAEFQKNVSEKGFIEAAKIAIKSHNEINKSSRETFQDLKETYFDYIKSVNEVGEQRVIKDKEQSEEITDEERKRIEEFQRLQIQLTEFTNSQRDMDVEAQLEHLTTLSNNIKKYGEKIIADAKERNRILIDIEKQKEKILDDIRAKRIKKEQEARLGDLEKLGEYVKNFKKLGDNILSIQKLRLEGMDKNDKERIEKQKKRMRAVAIANKAIAIAEIAIDTAKAVVKSLPNIPLSILVGSVGVAQGIVAAATSIPTFKKGVSELDRDKLAQLHKGERVIPAGMNMPGVSNANLMGMAYQGMANPMGAGATNISNTRTDNQKYITISGVTIQEAQNARDMLTELEEIAEDTGSRLLSR
jgi:TP901 family phage tail tape measure protein